MIDLFLSYIGYLGFVVVLIVVVFEYVRPLNENWDRYSNLAINFSAVFVAVSLAFWQERLVREETREENLFLEVAGFIKNLTTLEHMYETRFTDHVGTLLHETPLAEIAFSERFEPLEALMSNTDFALAVSDDGISEIQREYFFARWVGRRAGLAAEQRQSTLRESGKWDDEVLENRVVGYIEDYFRYVGRLRQVFCSDIVPELAASRSRGSRGFDMATELCADGS